MHISRQRLSWFKFIFLKKIATQFVSFLFLIWNAKMSDKKALMSECTLGLRIIKTNKKCQSNRERKDLPIRKTLESKHTSYNAYKVDNNRLGCC